MKFIAAGLLLLLCNLAGAATSESDACPLYDASKIRLVTFDCFAALMNWEDSMRSNVAAILPSLSESQVNDLVSKWESSYGANQGRVFEESQSGADAFSWSISTDLNGILNDMGISVTRSEYDQLVKSWGNLTPWDGTQEALAQIASSNITIGALSNGDYWTLKQATSIFVEPVMFQYIFSSDFPVGSFKPDKAIYDQVTGTTEYELHEILHVAGGKTDGQGSRDAGLFSALLHDDPVADGLQPCFVLDDISQLPAVLGL